MAHIISSNEQIIIKAILTKAGRERLASGVQSFNIVKFAASDDQIDYSIPGLQGTLQESPGDYPVLQPIMNGNLMMKNKLYTNPAINAGVQVLTDIYIDGLKQDQTNIIVASPGQVVYTPTTIGGAPEFYNIELNFQTTVPFSEISYQSGQSGTIASINIGDKPFIFNINNATKIIFTKKQISNPIYFNMTVVGVNTAAIGTYTFKVVPSSYAYDNTQTESQI